MTAICGDMQFEGRHFKKKVARDMASKKLLDALGKREQVCESFFCVYNFVSWGKYFISKKT